MGVQQERKREYVLDVHWEEREDRFFFFNKKKDKNKLGWITYSACWFCVGT